MKKYLDMKNESDLDKLDEVANIIKNGGIVLFPTETVYAIGTNGMQGEAVKRIYEAKGRDFKNPINLLVSSKEMVESVAKDITKLEYELMDKFFPGAFTIILNKKESVPDIVTAGKSSVGVRMPSGEIARKIVEKAKCPIAAPSANLSGKPSGTNIEDIIEEFRGKVDYIVDGGDSQIGIESTIVKVIDGVPHILRPGAITEEQIQEVAGTVILDYENNEENKILPSSKLKHYKVNTKCVLVSKTEKQQVETHILNLASKYKKTIVICTNESAKVIEKQKNNILAVFNVGAKENFEEISKNIFRLLRKADSLNPDIIIIEEVQEKRYW